MPSTSTAQEIEYKNALAIADLSVQVGSLASTVEALVKKVDRNSDGIQDAKAAQAKSEGREGKVPLTAIAAAVALTLAVVALVLDPLRSDIDDIEKTAVNLENDVDDAHSEATRLDARVAENETELDIIWPKVFARLEQDGYDRRFREETDRQIAHLSSVIERMASNRTSSSDDKQDALLERLQQDLKSMDERQRERGGTLKALETVNGIN